MSREPCISDEELSPPALRVDGFIGNYSARILIDSGAEANFVAKRFVDQDDMRRQRLRIILYYNRSAIVREVC